MYQYTVDILGIDNSNELTAVRSNLEWWGVKTNLYWIGQARHLLELLGGEEKRSEYILLGGHGTQKGFCLPELAKELEQEQPFSGNLGPEVIKKHLRFEGNMIISNACMTGTETVAAAFLDQGASYYIGPKDYPEGNATLHFTNCFYYFLFCQQQSIEVAFQKAKYQDQETQLFELFKK